MTLAVSPSNHHLDLLTIVGGRYITAGGRYPNPDSNVPVPDWVDATVADWIKSETENMEAAWGPSDSRGAVAFVHIPPYVTLSWTVSSGPLTGTTTGMRYKPFSRL